MWKRKSLQREENGEHEKVTFEHIDERVLSESFKCLLVLFMIGIAMIVNYYNNNEFISLDEVLNESMVYGGGILTVLLTFALYKTLSMIPVINKNMLISSYIVGWIALYLLYLYVLIVIGLPVGKTIFKTIVYLILFFMSFMIILILIECAIEKIYTVLENMHSSSIYKPDDKTIQKLALCALLVAPLIYIPILFSVLIPIWNFLFE